jgi:hypothetical protein
MPTILQITLAAVVPFDILNFSQDNTTNTDLTGEFARGVAVGDNGSFLYVGSQNTDTLTRWTLSTPYDLTTKGSSVQGISFGAQAPNPAGIFFRPDGTNFYVVERTTRTIYQYSMSTPWDITGSSAAYQSKSLTFGSSGTGYDVFIRDDGLRLYATEVGVGGSDSVIHEYSLTVAWDIATASFEDSFTVASSELQGISALSGGQKLIVVDNITDNLREIVLSTPWDLTTAQAPGVGVNATGGNLTGLDFQGGFIYVVHTGGGATGGRIDRYSD